MEKELQKRGDLSGSVPTETTTETTNPGFIENAAPASAASGEPYTPPQLAADADGDDYKADIVISNEQTI